MRKLFIASLIFGIVMTSASAFAKNDKNNKNNDRTPVLSEKVEDVAKPVSLTNPQKQLNGEWTILSVQDKNVTTSERAYIYLDFKNKMVYGCNGVYTINGNFTLDGQDITFSNMIQGTTAYSDDKDKKTASELMKTFNDVKKLEITNLNNIDYLSLKNSKGNEMMKLRRLNFDYINGPWLVKKIGDKDMTKNNIRTVIDIEMLTIHVLTKCNIINGVVNIDKTKEREVQFEDLKSTHYTCSDINAETEILINLEEVVSCRKISDTEVMLLGPQQYNYKTQKMEEQELILLTHLDLKK